MIELEQVTAPVAPPAGLAVRLATVDSHTCGQMTRVVVDGAPGVVAMLPADELERRSWQFALRRDGAVAAAPPPGAQTSSAGLALSSGEGPILLRLGPRPADLRVTAGALVRTRGTRAALRFVGEGFDLVAAFPSRTDRDRAYAAIEPERLASARTDAPPPSRGATSRRTEDSFPAPLRAAAVSLAAVGAVVAVGGAIGLPGAVDQRAELIPSLVQIVMGVAIIGVGWGVWLRRGWVDGIGFTVAWVAAAIAAFLVVAAPQCGLWLAPNLAACEAAGPLGSVAALGAAAALAFAAFAIRRHASALVR
jgi:hypothetical protein